MSPRIKLRGGRWYAWVPKPGGGTRLQNRTADTGIFNPDEIRGEHAGFLGESVAPARLMYKAGALPAFPLQEATGVLRGLLAARGAA